VQRPLGEIGAVDETGTGEIGVCEIGVCKIGADEIGVCEIGAGEIGVCEIGVCEIGVCKSKLGAERGPVGRIRRPKAPKRGVVELPTVDRGVVAGDVTHAAFGEQVVAALHFSHGPGERVGSPFRVDHDLGEQVGRPL